MQKHKFFLSVYFCKYDYEHLQFFKQVTERLNPLLETNAKIEDVQFLVPEKGGLDQMDVGKSFVVIATLATPTSTSQMCGDNCGISLALRNRFVTIHVESPDLNSSEIRKEIARSVLSRMTIKKINAASKAGNIEGVPNSYIPSTLQTTILNTELINNLSEAIANTKLPPCTVRDIALLATAVGWAHGTIEWKEPEELVRACTLDEKWLASDEADTLILHTVGHNKPGQRFFFSTHDRYSPMWQVMAALCMASASAQHLFLQVLNNIFKKKNQ
jgi:hypothetical protein